MAPTLKRVRLALEANNFDQIHEFKAGIINTSGTTVQIV